MQKLPQPRAVDGPNKLFLTASQIDMYGGDADVLACAFRAAGDCEVYELKTVGEPPRFIGTANLAASRALSIRNAKSQ